MAFDFFAGCLGGLAGVVVGHPFDTVKVRLQIQTTRRYTGVVDCFKQIVKHESVLGLYKGMASPMAGLGLINAIIFGVQGEMLRQLNQPGLNSQCIAGAVAGAVQTIVCCPMELAKTRVQVQGQGQKYRHIFFLSLEKKHMNYTGSIDCIHKVFQSQGIKGCYRGMTITVLRDVPSFAIYFGSFQFLCELFTPQGTSMENLSLVRLFFAGGIGGTLSWVLTYPIDMVKSCYQADGGDLKASHKYKGTIDCVRQIYRAGGVAAFGRGMIATVLRAFPVNAATLTVVTITLRFARNPDQQFESL